jgi:hypothetical protein
LRPLDVEDEVKRLEREAGSGPRLVGCDDKEEFFAVLDLEEEREMESGFEVGASVWSGGLEDDMVDEAASRFSRRLGLNNYGDSIGRSKIVSCNYLPYKL